jgi:hypothetical protein
MKPTTIASANAPPAAPPAIAAMGTVDSAVATGVADGDAVFDADVVVVVGMLATVTEVW